MDKEWDQSQIQQYIENEIEESTIIEYKSAKALGKEPEKKKKIAKHISAMANANGGTIFYGISEYQKIGKKHKPEKIDPIDNTKFSKEWLEQVIISNIQPLIEGLTIHPVKIDTGSNDFVYVVEIPQSTTAHQVTTNKDCRYYERLNFEVKIMEDYRIRDVMNRVKNPNIEVIFGKKDIEIRAREHIYRLIVEVYNPGEILAKYWKLIFTFPILFDYDDAKKALLRGINSEFVNYRRLQRVFKIEFNSKHVLFPKEKIIPSDYFDITYTFNDNIFIKLGEIQPIKWQLYADNMIPKKGDIIIPNCY